MWVSVSVVGRPSVPEWEYHITNQGQYVLLTNDPVWRGRIKWKPTELKECKLTTELPRTYLIHTLKFIPIDIANWSCKIIFRFLWWWWLKTVGMFFTLVMCVYVLVCIDNTFTLWNYGSSTFLFHWSVRSGEKQWHGKQSCSQIPFFGICNRVHTFSSLSSSITPSFSPLVLMNSAHQKCPVEEVCLWQ